MAAPQRDMQERKEEMILNNNQLNLGSFVVKPYRSKRIKDYCKMFSRDSLKVLMDPHVVAVLAAQGFHADIETPRSIYKVDKLYEALAHYAPNTVPAPKQGTMYNAGIALARKCFARPKDRKYLRVLPFTPQTIEAITSNPNGSSGLTNFGSKKIDSQVRALERGLQTLRGDLLPEPCIAFKRTQFNEKTRLVWGYPYSMTCIEGLVAKPLLDQFKGGSSPMSFAMTSGALGCKLRVAAYHKEWAYSLDMSQYDASLSAQLIHIAFKILRTWFDPHEIEPVSGLTVKQIFDRVENYFIHTPIVMPDGNLYRGKDHGVPSGSYFTQLVDSVCNVIIAGAVSERFHLHVDKDEMFVLGDDLLMWSNRRVDLDKIAYYVRNDFAVRMHGSEKSQIYHYDEPVHYLGRDWDNGLGDLPIQDIIARMVYPESYRKYPEDRLAAERQARILIAGYAWQYRRAWRIAEKVNHADARNIHRGCANVDVNLFIRDSDRTDWWDLPADSFSGYQRYLWVYHPDSVRTDCPNTAFQYWL